MEDQIYNSLIYRGIIIFSSVNRPPLTLVRQNKTIRLFVAPPQINIRALLLNDNPGLLPFVTADSLIFCKSFYCCPLPHVCHGTVLTGDNLLVLLDIA